MRSISADPSFELAATLEAARSGVTGADAETRVIGLELALQAERAARERAEQVAEEQARQLNAEISSLQAQLRAGGGAA